MSCELPALVIEIIELISTFLEPADLRALRLVCRELNSKTLHYFGLANFATVHTDLSRKSLQRLRSILGTEHLAVHVQHLLIKHTDNGKLAGRFDWHCHQWNLVASQLDGANLLRDVLGKRLLECRSFQIDSYDGLQPCQEADFLTPSDAVGMVLSVIAEADLAVRSFSVKSVHGGNRGLDTKRLQTALSRTSQLIAAWSCIEELVLDYGATSDQHDWILHLISSAPRLRTLSLRFQDTGSLFMESLSLSHSLDRLEDLSLSSTRMTVESISRLLLRNRETLHSLSFQRARIDGGGKWATVLENMKGQLPRLESLLLFWLMEQIATHCVIFFNLTGYPSIPGARESGPGGGRLSDDSYLLDSVEEPVRLRYGGGGRMVVGVEYHGNEIDNVLSILADAAETQ